MISSSHLVLLGSSN